MRKTFEEYGLLLICFVGSIIGFNLLTKLIIHGDKLHNIINRFIYGGL